eukprot:TRINITY_DN6127_c0_g3_i2.p1 TRINITY_DN6127_c0_g3~~TRINITY_DN6127_c0_g3_i2.p1  ORF type:complete len:121 (+),score=21.96 TRINITY_DN6127_c0_g3_i2:43-405(+)
MCIRDSPRTSASQFKINRTEFAENNITTLEEWIDTLDAQLPPLKNFILPSGGFSSSYLHLARSTCRRAERSVVPLIRDQEVDAVIGRYLNRLSDFFFVAARYAAQKEGKIETIYTKDLKK